jgi:hypothetical protein|tara:strand:- start:1971 stop:2666 length:696 start_codon:yes stop_codon:yes gene_type:complete
MKKIEYVFIDKKVVHILQLKPSQNSKLGFGMVVQTYHFSLEQIKANEFKLDKSNCLGCPYSYTSEGEKSGKCYTHKGMQRLGLVQMLKRLHNNLDSFSTFDKQTFDNFMAKVHLARPILVRFGTYGEPSLLGEELLKDISDGYNFTGYTHAWRKFSLGKYLMASTHTTKERKQANKRDYRTFNVVSKDYKALKDEVNCPASKESGKKATCITCGLCKGTQTKAKDIYIIHH